MVRYRRNYVPGGMFFFIVTLDDRRSSALVDHVALLRAAFRKTRSEQPFAIDAIVILPDHLHAIMTLPSGDSDFPADGGGSRAPLPAVLSQPACQSHATIEANIRYGKSAFGNTPSAMTAISNAAPTTFISIRSSIDWCHRQPRGRFSRCIDTPAPACWPAIGVEMVAWMIRRISASARNPLRSPDGAERNPGSRHQVSPPDFAIGRRFAPIRWLHPGYRYLPAALFGLVVDELGDLVEPVLVGGAAQHIADTVFGPIHRA
jgi:hypothetical protein